MKKVLVLVMLAIMTVSCHGVSPDAGEEAVLIYKPWFFGHGSIDDDAVGTGLTWCFWSTSSETFNLKPMKITEKFDDLITSDNVPVDFDAFLTVSLIEGKTPFLLREFGVNWYSNSCKEQFRTFTRNYAKKQKLFELTTSAVVLNQGEKVVLDSIRAYVKKKGLPINIDGVTIGKVSPPAAVLAETSKTAAMKQSKKTNLEREGSELARVAAESASAKADKAYRTEMGMTTDQYLRSRALDIQEKQIIMAEKSAGKVTVLFNQGAVPTMKVN